MKNTSIRRTAAALAIGGVAAATMSMPAANAVDGATWDALAQCESGGNWSINTGNGFYGGLQFTQQSWNGVGMSGSPANATRAQQIEAGERLLAIQGWGVSLASTARPAQLPPTPSPPPPWLHSRRPSRPTPLPRHRLHPQLLQLRLHPQQLRLPQQHRQLRQLRQLPQQLRHPQQHRQLRLPQPHPLQLPRLQQAPTPWFPVTPSR